jgi:hypothetical protein
LWKEFRSGRLCVCSEGQHLLVASEVVEEAIPKAISSALPQADSKTTKMNWRLTPASLSVAQPIETSLRPPSRSPTINPLGSLRSLALESIDSLQKMGACKQTSWKNLSPNG